MRTFLAKLSSTWVERNSVLPRLQINDISLIRGGHFDISGSWSNPHKQHFYGNDVDIHYVGAAHEEAFSRLVNRLGNVRWHGIHNNHHHISLHDSQLTP